MAISLEQNILLRWPQVNEGRYGWDRGPEESRIIFEITTLFTLMSTADETAARELNSATENSFANLLCVCYIRVARRLKEELKENSDRETTSVLFSEDAPPRPQLIMIATHEVNNNFGRKSHPFGCPGEDYLVRNYQN